MDKNLPDVPTFPYQKPQEKLVNHLDSSKLYKVATPYLPLKNSC